MKCGDSDTTMKSGKIKDMGAYLRPLTAMAMTVDPNHGKALS
jgi:hypothetical protein